MALLVLAAHARRAGWEPKVIDENFDKIPAETPDLACLTVWTPIAPQAYRLADAYRAKGVPVVLGGVHPSLLPGEALRHCDSVVSGEADTIFATVLADAAAGSLQRLYKGTFQDMDAVPMNHEWIDIYKTWPIYRYAPLKTLRPPGAAGSTATSVPSSASTAGARATVHPSGSSRSSGA